VADRSDLNPDVQPSSHASKRLVVATAVLLAFILLAGCGSPDAETATPLLPSFPLGTTDGQILDIADFNGQDTLFWFWAPW